MHRLVRTMIACAALATSAQAQAQTQAQTQAQPQAPAETQAQAPTPAWIAQSNAHAQSLLDLMARYAPESTAAYGVEGHDADTFDLRPDADVRRERDLAQLADQLEARIPATADARVRQDLQILVQAARDERTTSELNRRLMLPYVDLGETLFYGFRSLLDPRVDPARYPAALTRLRKYIGREPGFEPITKLAQARSAERFETAGLTGPWTVEVEQSLANQPRYIDGIREVLRKSGLKGWERDFQVLEKQLVAHGEWVRKEILPRARKDNRLPPEIYADNLRNVGVKTEPQQLIARALVGFQQTRDEMQALARLVAQQRKLTSSDYRDVLRVLKAEKIPDDQLLPIYRARLAALEEIIRRERIVTLPERAAVIRLGTEAESASIPAPHVSPPRLIGNTGEAAEFVLPLDNPNAPAGTQMDDFNFDAITWTLTAHEARPGHELQFARMMEAGVSTARAVFAFNSANAEGWALYAEAVMKQYLPLEGQLGTLQMRLMRAARAFLDPMVNLGQITPDAAQRFLMQEVVLSEPMAKQEVDRYSFRMPGQATAYFYGYERQQQIRAKAEMALGARFDALSYHDFIVNQGLLPPELLEQAVMEHYVAERQAAQQAAQ
jgi:hypothetical protein